MSIRNVRESTKKKIAGKQYYKCANEPSIILYNLKNYKCPMWLLYNGHLTKVVMKLIILKNFLYRIMIWKVTYKLCVYPVIV